MSGDTVRYSSSSPTPALVQADNPLTTLIRRLEAATSRLEDIASSAGTLDESQQEHRPNGSISAQSGIPASSSMPELASKGGERETSAATVQPALPPSIVEMDELIGAQVKDFQAASKGLDALIHEQVSCNHMTC